jgi:hypothetical protein
LHETYDYLGDELLLWQAEYAINPWGPERGDVNAWKIGCELRLARGQKPPPFSMFDQTKTQQRVQPISEAKRNIEQAVKLWPKKKPQATIEPKPKKKVKAKK